MRPGTNVTVQSQLPANTPPIDSGTWFIVGACSQGPVAPQSAGSLQEWQGIYGGRGTTPTMSDSVEAYFLQGGTEVVTARLTGPDPVNATITLEDSVPADSCSVTAIGPGTYANGYKVVVAGSGPFTITIEDSSSNVLEESNSLATVADAVAYGQTSSYVRVANLGGGLPVAGTFTLAAGADDLADVTTSDYTASLALFTSDFGIGQVSVPGVTTSAIQEAIVAHCNAFNRVAYLDAIDSATAATVTGNTTPIRALGTAARKSMTCGPWADLAALPGSTGGVRAVPPSALWAGKAAWCDVTTGNPNQAAAGQYGDLNGVVSLHAYYSDADRATLNTAGVNIIRKMPSGAFRCYGNVTAVDRLTDPLYFMLSNVRLDMVIIAQAQEIGEEYMFSQIDGAGTDASDYGNELVNLLTAWQVAGALFVGVDGVSFTVDTGSDVNTPTTESEGELIATIATVRSPGAEQVNLNIVRVSAAQGL